MPATKIIKKKILFIIAVEDINPPGINLTKDALKP